jgi:hypothetical protein
MDLFARMPWAATSRRNRKAMDTIVLENPTSVNGIESTVAAFDTARSRQALADLTECAALWVLGSSRTGHE